MSKFFLSIIALLSTFMLKAQDIPQIGFSAKLVEPINQLNEANTQSLLIKIDQIIARNGYGASAAISSIFVVYPSFVITKEDVIETGMRPVNVLRAELSLFAMNLIDKSIYGTTTISLEGNGRSQQEAIQSMFANLRATNTQFAKFIKGAANRIVDYYAVNTPVLLTRAQTLANNGDYENALAILSTIPETVNNYDMVASRMNELFEVVADRQGKASIQKANACIAIQDYVGALNALLEVNPISKQFENASALIEQIKDKAKQKADEDFERELQKHKEQRADLAKIYNDSIELEKLRIEASKQAGTALAKTKIKEAEAKGGDAIALWLFGKTK